MEKGRGNTTACVTASQEQCQGHQNKRYMLIHEHHLKERQ